MLVRGVQCPGRGHLYGHGQAGVHIYKKYVLKSHSASFPSLFPIFSPLYLIDINWFSLI
jgi:hypothetical protein